MTVAAGSYIFRDVRRLGEFLTARMFRVGYKSKNEFITANGLSRNIVFGLLSLESEPVTSQDRSLHKIAVALKFEEWAEVIKAWQEDDISWGMRVEMSKQPSGLNMSTMTPGRAVPHFHGVDAAKLTHREPITRDTIPAPAGGADTFWITVDGDCMEPEFPHGTMVLFSPSKALSSLASDKAYFVQLEDGESTFKQVVIPVDNRHELILHPTNPKYPDRTIRRDQVQIIARVVGVFNPKS